LQREAARSQQQLAAGTKCIGHVVQRVVHALQERRIALHERLGQLQRGGRIPGQQLPFHLIHPALQRLAKRTRFILVEILRGAAPARQGLAEMVCQPLGLLSELQPCQPSPHGLVFTGELQQHASERRRVLLADKGFEVLGKRRQHGQDCPLQRRHFVAEGLDLTELAVDATNNTTAAGCGRALDHWCRACG
jgi:hypothetical protein